MPRRCVEFQAGCYYHIYNRGHNRQLIFFEGENYIYFLQKLRIYLIEKGKIDIIAYCLIPNHYHLLIHLKTPELSPYMQGLSLAYTKAINKRYERVGSLFQGRFQAIHVDHEAYLAYLTRYIHLNPVAAKLVSKAEDWEFSSYPEYANLRRGTLPQVERVRGQFPSVDDYRLFVEAQMNHSEIQRFTFDE